MFCFHPTSKKTSYLNSLELEPITKENTNEGALGRGQKKGENVTK